MGRECRELCAAPLDPQWALRPNLESLCGSGVEAEDHSTEPAVPSTEGPAPAGRRRVQKPRIDVWCLAYCDGMDIDREALLRLSESRDPRFDGQVFVGVVTSGVYCRPSCPGGGAKPDNLRFFSSAAAAEVAGLRPCRRCRPEAVPGSPAWRGTSSTISRGLQMISEGAFEEIGAREFASRLGLGTRQVTRLFLDKLGATPAALARTRRIHFARKLLDETELPMGHVAAQAGFRSLRQFNDSMRRTFHMTPSELRRQGRREVRQASPSSTVLHLACREPYDWSGILEFLRPLAIPGVEHVTDEAYRRVLDLDDQLILIEMRRRQRSEIELRIEAPALPALLRIVELARRAFDLDCDPADIAEHLSGDSLMDSRVVGRAGLRVPGSWNPFETAVTAVLGARYAPAAHLAGRIARTFGKPVARAAGELTHSFPGPEALAQVDLVSVGVPRSRAEAVRQLAAEVANNRILFTSGRSAEETRNQLQAIAGIGRGTLEHIAMRCLNDPDAFPASDTAIRRAMSMTSEPISTTQASQRSARWRPWRSYAAIALLTPDNDGGVRAPNP